MKILINFCLICLPLRHFIINSPYGFRMHPISGIYAMHYGLDLKARKDTVFAILDGRVISEGNNKRLGINIHLSHGAVESIYGHLSRLLVGLQDSVYAGQPIAITGSSGCVTGEHLHFSIRSGQRYINPLKFLYKFLNNQQNERQFQKTAGSAFRKAGGGT
ncbi:M23 family metallopeptidase [Mucilaginibacter sp. cycad4]|uniref:M23 family metallopeptidase n=1 Tax=Mucilaginibacter sp. cycad4 TaxID=3342096 RepID=UPI002AABA255|nr:M23 family metallopeptidase [Mucilaginibacter gossypii]WPU99111.1 M23 family metallopeptidase [Mucilaginibacter gossypii]